MSNIDSIGFVCRGQAFAFIPATVIERRAAHNLLADQLRASVGLPSPDGPASRPASRSFHEGDNA